eukprot:g102.t1
MKKRKQGVLTPLSSDERKRPRRCSALRPMPLSRALGTGSLTRRLLDRQFCTDVNESNRRNSARDKFMHYRLVADLDTHDPDSLPQPPLPFFLSRSKIVEIVSTEDIIFGLTASGACAAFQRRGGRRICFLNVTKEEVIRSIFYNKANQSLITVSVYKWDNYSSLKCRSTTLDKIKCGEVEKGEQLFETEALNWPGFVEFDDVNGKVLTYSERNDAYKVWDLKDYSLKYALFDESIQEVKISPGIMLLIYNRSKLENVDEKSELTENVFQGKKIPLKIVDIVTGKVLKSWEHDLKEKKKIEFIEQFNEKLLVKQVGESLQIMDVRNSTVRVVPENEFSTPSAFIFLYENRLFLTFRERNISVWNFGGELVTEFEDHELWHSNCNTNNIYITNKQDLIISYCKLSEEAIAGTINVSSIITGQCLAKISYKEDAPNACHALQDVTSLHYNEKDNEIYTGTKDGHIHVWTN